MFFFFLQIKDGRSRWPISCLGRQMSFFFFFKSRTFCLCDRKRWSHSLSPPLRWCVLGKVRTLNLGPRLNLDRGCILASPLATFCFVQQGATPGCLIHQRRTRTSTEERKRRLVLKCLPTADWPDTHAHAQDRASTDCVSSLRGRVSPSLEDVCAHRMVQIFQLQNTLDPNFNIIFFFIRIKMC